jgi:hypothetical protein
MPQEELPVAFNIKKASVDPYVKAFCAFTGEPPPAPKGEVTAPELHHLLRAVMNRVEAGYQREQFVPVPAEGANE